jgi:DNA-binding transcriptional regulator YiaG
MSVTVEQCSRVAWLLYPELWETDRIEAVAKTIEFLHEAANEVSDGNSSNAQAGRSAVIKTLAEHMQRHGIHVNVVARELGVSPYTVRTWLEGKYKPNEQNSRKLEDFIAQEPALDS